MEHTLEVRFKANYIYILLIIVLLCGGIIFSLFYYFKIKFGVLDITGYITGMTATLTLIYYALSLKDQKLHNDLLNTFQVEQTNFYKEQIANQHEQKKNQILLETYKLAARWIDPNMLETVSNCKKLLTNKVYIDELKDSSKVGNFDKYLKENTDQRMHLFLVLNYFEHISVRMENEDLDNKIMKKLFKGLFVDYYKTLRHYMKYVNDTHPDNWSSFRTVSERWWREANMA